MAILFSKVVLSQESAQEHKEFFMSGIPVSKEDMFNWTAFENYMDNTTPGAQVIVDVTSYTYGGEELVVATPEEVAYMVMRIDRRPDFLESRCQQHSKTSFGFVK